MDGIDFKDIPSKEYDLAKILINLDDSNTFDAIISKVPITSTISSAISLTLVALPFLAHLAITLSTAVAASTQADNLNNLNKLCMPCVGCKSTEIVRQNKSMTVTISKLEKMHANF